MDVLHATDRIVNDCNRIVYVDIMTQDYKLGKDGVKYFVLRYDAEAEHGYINRTILHKWCNYISEYGLVGLADDLLNDIREETNKAFGKGDDQTRATNDNEHRIRLGSLDFTNLGEDND